MIRTLPRITAIFLAVATAACSDSPVAPTATPEVVSAESRWGGRSRIATDAASLQAALDAVAEGARRPILVRGTIALDEPLVYAGDRDVTIIGLGARIVGPVQEIAPPSNSGERVGEPTVGDALQIFGAPDLTIRNVAFSGQTGHGIYIELPGDASGKVGVDLTRVTFRDQGLAGLWFEDQANAAGPIESDASVDLRLTRVKVQGTGFAADEDGGCPGASEDDGCEWADFDGMRINEGGHGGITFAFRDVEFTGNAGDGIEFDEKGRGSVRGAVLRGSFDGNGSQPQFPEDLEDGFDIDEAGPGGIHLTMWRVSIDDNIDEGLDLDEEGEGDVRLFLTRVQATGNQDDNVKVSEDADLEDSGPAGDTGGISFAFTRLVADGSLDGDGVGLEGFGAGRVTGTIFASRIRGNADDGLQAEQATGGAGLDGRIRIFRSEVTDNGDDDLNLENIVVN